MSADIEAGYGPASFDVAESVEVVLDVGAVGVNIEDRRRDAKGPLFALAEQCERLGAARDAADRRIDAFTINARTDVYLGAVGEPDQREEMVLERREPMRRRERTVCSFPASPTSRSFVHSFAPRRCRSTCSCPSDRGRALASSRTPE